MIYTVKSGDTLYDIAKAYNTTIATLTEVNGLTRPNDLVVGQSLLIPDTQSASTYTVVRGDTMYEIARRFGISLDSLIRANPQISNPNVINIGDRLNIPNNKRNIEVNGYAIANISSSTLSRTLPYLTYFSIFSYEANSLGGLSNLYETNLISQARDSSVAPIMVVTNIGNSGGFDSDLAHTILNNQNIGNTLISNIMSVLSDKNYYGVDIDFEYLYPEDRVPYIDFLRRLKTQLNTVNKTLSVAVAPKYRDNQSGLLYEAHDYRAIGEIADRVIIMTYEWGYVYGEPMAISPLREVEAVISYAVTRIPSNKILMGMPNYAYDWALPYTPGTSASTISNTRALELAIENKVNINFDPIAQAPYFMYMSDGIERIVWFDDPRSIDARLNLVTKYNLGGISFWTINYFYAPNYYVTADKFNITKVL